MNSRDGLTDARCLLRPPPLARPAPSNRTPNAIPISNICLSLEGNVPETTDGNPWRRLCGKIAPEILVAPRTAGDPCNQGTWPEVPQRVVTYLENNVLRNPWGEILALLAAVMM